MSTPNVVIHADALAAALLCTSADRRRPQLQGVLVQEDGTVTATDGHILISLKGKACPAADWPGTASPNGGRLTMDGAILSADAVKLALSAARAARKDHHGLAGKVALTVAESGTIEAGAGFAHRCAIDTIEGPYPNYEQVIPKQDPTFSIGFSVQNLKRLVAACEKAGAENVRLDFLGHKGACRVTRTPGPNGTCDATPFVALIMPVLLPEHSTKGGK